MLEFVLASKYMSQQIPTTYSVCPLPLPDLSLPLGVFFSSSSSSLPFSLFPSVSVFRRLVVASRRTCNVDRRQQRQRQIYQHNIR